MGEFTAESWWENREEMFQLILIALPLVSGYPGFYSYHAQRIGNHQGFENEISYGPQNSIIPRFYRSGPFPSYKRSFLSVGSGLTKTIPTSDVVGETRNLARSLTSTLKGLATNPSSAAAVNQIISDNYSPCLNSIEEGLASIESATKLVESIGPDVQALMDKFNSFESLSEPADVVRETGALLRLLKPLSEKTFPASRSDCEVGSLRSLAVLTSELADKTDINLGVREKLRRSSAGISSVTTYLVQLQGTSARLENFCTADNKYDRSAIAAIGDLMDELADLYGALGDAKTGERIRYGKVYTDKVTASLVQLDTVGLGSSDCSQHGDLSAAAQTLEDLATLIDDVGIENLQEQLGTDVVFDFDFEPSAAPTFRRFKY